ncbi:MAG: CehA/McbA family metallohydrolase [Bryobacteraceae bacterium]
MRRTLLASAFAGLLLFADLPTRSPYPGFVRLKFSIRDEAGRATAARVRITDAKGEYWAPLGHLPQPDQSRRTAGDLILGDDETSPRRLYAYVYDGHQIDLPPGDYTLDASKGLDYRYVHQTVSIATQSTTVPIPLKRFGDFESRGWYPGDTHMHFPDPAGVRYEMEAEGLRVCSLLLLKSGYKEPLRPGNGNFWNAEHFTGKLNPVSDARHWVKVGEEFRHGLLAHLIFQNLKSVVWPVSVGQLRENGVGGFDWPLMIHACDDAHAQGALVTWAHWPYPSMEAPLDIALGRVDSLDILTTGNPFEHHPILVDVYKMFGPSAYSRPPIEMYYHYLNCGFRVAASSGSDKMALNPPIGSARTYVKTAGALSYDSWIEGIRKGRTFITTAPLLEFSVNGAQAGDTLALAPGKARLAVSAKAVSQEPYEVLEILVNGKVVRTAKPSGDRNEAVINETIEVERGGWIAARAHGPKMLPYGATWWMMPVFAHSSPIYLQMPGRPADARESARVLLEQLGYFEKWAETKAVFPTPENKREALALAAKARAIYEHLRE